MGSKIQCFFLEQTDRAEIVLRRYASNVRGSCPGPMSYHNVRTVVGQCDFEPPSDVPDLVGYGGRTDRKDPRWPTACSCGYVFKDDGKGWTRTGTPPKVTANPSIGLGKVDGGGWAYHGWLTNGFLIEA